MRVAIATNGKEGLEDTVSQHFGYANTFTLIEIENGVIKNIEVLDNPAIKLNRRKGPTIANILADKGVSIVIASEMGPGALEALNNKGIKLQKVDAGIRVIDVLKLLGLVC